MDASALDDLPPFLSLAGIGKKFGGTVALEGIDWSVDPGEVHCLVGENGSGKSTLIKIVSGVHAPDRGGSIAIDGSGYSSLTPQLPKSLGVQVIFQDLFLFPNLTVLENIAIDRELTAPLLPPPRHARGGERGARSLERAPSLGREGRDAPSCAAADRRYLPRAGRERPDPIHG